MTCIQRGCACIEFGTPRHTSATHGTVLTSSGVWTQCVALCRMRVQAGALVYVWARARLLRTRPSLLLECAALSVCALPDGPSGVVNAGEELCCEAAWLSNSFECSGGRGLVMGRSPQSCCHTSAQAVPHDAAASPQRSHPSLQTVQAVHTRHSAL